MRVGVIGHAGNETNPELVRAWRAAGIDALLLSPEAAATWLRAGDVALARLDVLKSLDGVEPGLGALSALEWRGVRVLNRRAALLGAHDKLATARLLRLAGLPHPLTVHVTSPHDRIELPPPVVLKPRFGSWGRDVLLCRDDAELRECLFSVQRRPWFVKHGALVQELVPPRRHDLRLIVAGGRLVGAARRQAAAGEWRTNVSLGGELALAEPDDAASALAIAAANAIGTDLAGVDLLPLEDGSHVVLELNGAVDFDDRYSMCGGDVYLAAAAELGLQPVVARELSRDPKLLIASQPTRGLDVGATEFVHRRLVQEREAGRAIVLVSFTLEEILSLSDRILVLYEGRIVGEFPPTASKEELGIAMTGGRPVRRPVVRRHQGPQRRPRRLRSVATRIADQ